MRNSGHNLVRALSSSFVSVLLPLMLIAVLPHSLYAAWAIVYGLAAYVLFLDLGVPTAVQTIVARGEGLNEPRVSIAAELSGLKVMSAIVAVCLIGAVGVASTLRVFFPAIPESAIQEAQVALVVISTGQLSNLVANTVSAYFAGQQRNHIPTALIAPSRIISMMLAATAALLYQDLIFIAVCYAAPLVLGTSILALRFWNETRALSGFSLDSGPLRQQVVNVRYLLSYSGPLIIWNLAGLVISGTGLVIVARLDYPSIISYSFGSVLVAAQVGLGNALTGPVLPELGRLHGASGIGAVEILTRQATRLNGLFALGAAGILVGTVPFLSHVFLAGTKQPPFQIFAIVTLLVTASALRSCMTPLSLAFIATKRHHRVIAPPVLEAVLTLILSLGLGFAMGATGVALGVFLGALSSLLITLTWSIRLTRLQSIGRQSLLRDGVLKPLLVVGPMYVAGLLIELTNSWDGLTGYGFISIGFAGSLTLAISSGLDSTSRVYLMRRVTSIVRRNVKRDTRS